MAGTELSRLPRDLPLSPAALRGKLRRIAVQDGDAWASGSGVYVLDTADTYELAEGDFPSGLNIDDKFDWFGCLCYDDF